MHRQSVRSEREGLGEFSDLLFVYVFIYLFLSYLSLFKRLLPAFRVDTMYNVADRGSTVVKELCYKSEGQWFDPSWCQWIFH